MQSYTPNCFNVMQRCFTSHFSWKYLIKSNLTKSFFPINVAKNSIPYLSTVNPFQRHPCLSKIRNGMSGSLEYLQELTSLVFGDFLQESFMAVIREDINTFGTTTDELFHNWHRIPQQIQLNNLHLSTTKIAISLLQTTILAWIW